MSYKQGKFVLHKSDDSNHIEKPLTQRFNAPTNIPLVSKNWAISLRNDYKRPSYFLRLVGEKVGPKKRTKQIDIFCTFKHTQSIKQ